VTLAALALVLAMVPLGPAAPARAGLESDANNSCPATTGLPRVTGRAIDYTGSLTCYRPGATSFSSTNSPVPSVPPPATAPGDPCMSIYYYPVSFAESDQGDIRASYRFAGNTGSASIGLSPAESSKALTADAFVTDAKVGTYQLSSPSDPSSQLTCNLGPTYHSYCALTGAVDQFCYDWVAHPITPATAPRPRSIAPYLGQVLDEIHGDAGRIASAPSQTGVVNAAVCFWIEGMGIPAERDLVLTLPVPDRSGRQIFYTYLIRISLQDPVQWDFGDPHGNGQSQPNPACGQHPQLTAHKYTEISDDIKPDGRYHVTAYEQYAITADLSWQDSDGNHGPFPVDPGVTAPVIRPPDYAQYVGQVEGIPVGG
jgi:hypothetical protein